MTFLRKPSFKNVLSKQGFKVSSNIDQSILYVNIATSDTQSLVMLKQLVSSANKHGLHS